MAKKKVLLMGKAHSGKTSMRSIIFANYLARDTMRLSPTLDVEHHHVRFLGDLVLNLWDCGGQDAFYESYFERDRETIFRSVEMLIYVFDIESDCPEKDFDHFAGVLEAIEENSPDARIFVLVHKMDLVTEEEREDILKDRFRLIEEACAGVSSAGTGNGKQQQQQHAPPNLQCFGTSIWDETLYKAWSEIVTNLIPNIDLLESHLDEFCRICDADEVVLFERATFLVISHARAAAPPVVVPPAITNDNTNNSNKTGIIDGITDNTGKRGSGGGSCAGAGAAATLQQDEEDISGDKNLGMVVGSESDGVGSKSDLDIPDVAAAAGRTTGAVELEEPPKDGGGDEHAASSGVEPSSSTTAALGDGGGGGADAAGTESAEIPSVVVQASEVKSPPPPSSSSADDAKLSDNAVVTKTATTHSPTNAGAQSKANAALTSTTNVSSNPRQQQQDLQPIPPPPAPHPTPHFDAHRFEKISNIVKQFKLSCGKTGSQFQGMEVRNSRFSAFIDAFTPNTYIMVIVSDPTVGSATTLLNIKNATRHFERLIPRT